MSKGRLSKRSGLWLAVLAWAVLMYLSAFLVCARFYSAYFMEPPPDGVGQYVYFSPNPRVDRALYAVFRPPVAFVEAAGWFAYAPGWYPDFYDDWDLDWPLGLMGWGWVLWDVRPGGAGLPLHYAGVGIAVGLITLTVMLLALMAGRWRGRRTGGREAPETGSGDGGTRWGMSFDATVFAGMNALLICAWLLSTRVRAVYWFLDGLYLVVFVVVLALEAGVIIVRRRATGRRRRRPDWPGIVAAVLMLPLAAFFAVVGIAGPATAPLAVLLVHLPFGFVFAFLGLLDFGLDPGLQRNRG